MMVHKAADGSIAITMFAPEIENDAEAKALAVARFKEQHPGKYIESYEGDFELPDGKHRHAWTFKDNKVIIDENKLKSLGEVK